MGGLVHRLVVTVASIVWLGLWLPGARTMPNPDFGIQASISSRGEVLEETRALDRAFGTLDDHDVTLVSGYALLNDVRAAIVSIAGSLHTSGDTLAGRLRSLAKSNGPNTDGAFGPVYDAIDGLKSQLATGQNVQLSALSSLTGANFIARNFRNSFRAMRETLEQLASRLQALQDSVAAARAASGGPGPVPSHVIRSKVSARVQNAVVSAIIDVRTRISAIRYLVYSTLEDLDTADHFLLDVTDEAQEQVTEMAADTLIHFQHSVGNLHEDIVEYLFSAVACVYNSQSSQLSSVVGGLTAISSYASSLQSSVESFAITYAPATVTSQTDNIALAFSTYAARAADLQDDLECFFQEETCRAIRETILVLVAGGPYNRYCFYSYSDRVYSLYEKHVYEASKCYETEYHRLATLADTLEGLVDLVLYDVEDLVYRLAVCVNLLANNDACVTTLGGLYSTLFGQTVAKVAIFVQLLTDEQDASYTRLSACVKSARYTTIHTTRRILRNLDRCKMHGAPRDESDESNGGME